ncbi:HIT domain-containing protein [Candidatus Margulisiibacteriota bacterium]
MTANCIFCKIIENKMKNSLIYEDDFAVAFNDIAPQAPTHILVIPKQHIEKLEALDCDLSKALFSAINKVSCKLKSFRVVMNYGKEAGQAVAHLHFHVLSGRKMNWPPG